MRDLHTLKAWADALRRGEMSTDDFVARASDNGVARTTDAAVDIDRARRCGFPEVIYGPGKSPESLVEIIGELHSAGFSAFATRVSTQQADFAREHFADARHNEVARTLTAPTPNDAPNDLPDDAPNDLPDDATNAGTVVVVSAGTSDRPVAEEAWETARWMGVNATLLQDLGVAGPHRLLEHVPSLQAADAIVVVAGMEGALPSVVAGHVACPVIAVPTSVGYGASFGGVAALLGMLNSCAANVSVVNIDAGFKGGYLAGMIAARVGSFRSGQRPT